MSRYILFPADDDSKDVKTIRVPEGLIFNELYMDLRDEVINKSKLHMIANTLARHDITESKDGSIMQGDEKIADGIDLRAALIDCCNGIFHMKYEKFYEILRKCDIVF